MDQPENPRRVQTTLRLPPDLLGDVDAAAARQDISRSEFIVRTLRHVTRKPAPVDFDTLY